jgi:hypothetical protein
VEACGSWLRRWHTAVRVPSSTSCSRTSLTACMIF